jgi:hypothetical protein
MAEKRVSVRLVAEGGRQVRAELEGIGEAGTRGFGRLGAAGVPTLASSLLDARHRRRAGSAAPTCGGAPGQRVAGAFPSCYSAVIRLDGQDNHRMGLGIVGPRAPGRLLIAGIACAGLVGLAGCRDRHVWAQEMTVTVLTPRGVVTGSSVVRVTALVGQQMLSGNEVDYDLTGEAVVVDIAPDRFVFATLDAPGVEIAEMYHRAGRERFAGRKRAEWLAEMPAQRGAVQVPPDLYPTFITFRDLDDPGTAEIVAPDAFAAVFGPGYSLVGVTLEVTDKAATTGRISRILTWLPELTGPYIHGGTTATGDPLSKVTVRHFSADD